MTNQIIDPFVYYRSLIWHLSVALEPVSYLSIKWVIEILGTPVECGDKSKLDSETCVDLWMLVWKLCCICSE